MIEEIPADPLATRWKFGNAEFRFYFNDTDAAEEYAIGPGSFKLWDPHTGHFTRYKQDRMLLKPGKAQLLLRKMSLFANGRLLLPNPVMEEWPVMRSQSGANRHLEFSQRRALF